MHTFKITFITLLISTLFYGCGSSGTNNNNSNNKIYPTALGIATSIGSEDLNNNVVNQSKTLTQVKNEIGTMLTTHITNINQQEATLFGTEFHYCSLSGSNELTTTKNNENSDSLTTVQNFDACQNEKTIQNGNIEILYLAINSDGKFPTSLALTSLDAYQFNDLVLEKNFVIESNKIVYDTNNPEQINSIAFALTGTLTYKGTQYTFNHVEEIVKF